MSTFKNFLINIGVAIIAIALFCAPGAFIFAFLRQKIELTDVCIIIFLFYLVGFIAHERFESSRRNREIANIQFALRNFCNKIENRVWENYNSQEKKNHSLEEKIFDLNAKVKEAKITICELQEIINSLRQRQTS